MQLKPEEGELRKKAMTKDEQAEEEDERAKGVHGSRAAEKEK